MTSRCSCSACRTRWTCSSGFVRLREGHRQFEYDMDIRRGPEETGTADVESATTAEELARALLDFPQRFADAPRDVEGAFADLMIHQVALLNGVMNGVKSLLAELSPAAIERYAEDPRRRGAGGLQIGPFRYRQLWELYAERHSDLADEEREAFGLIFGPDFARAYATFRRTATGQAWATGAAGTVRPKRRPPWLARATRLRCQSWPGISSPITVLRTQRRPRNLPVS